jgi:hypothetical protein
MSYLRLERRSQAIWQGGSASALTAAAAYRVSDIDFDPEEVAMTAGGAYIGQPYDDLPTLGRRSVKLGFKSFIRGHDVADIPPPEASLLRGCAFAETQNGNTPNVIWRYTHGDPHYSTGSPAGALIPVAAITFNYDNKQYIGRNLVGAVELAFEAGKKPYYKWDFKGQIAALAGTIATTGFSETAQSVALTAGSPAVTVASEGLTITPAAGSPYTPKFTKVSYKTGKVEDNDDGNAVGGAGIPWIADQQSELNIVINDDLLASYDPVQQFLDQRAQTIAWVHNTGGGVRQVLTCTMIGTISKMPKSTKVAGALFWDLTLQQTPGSTRFKAWWS